LSAWARLRSGGDLRRAERGVLRRRGARAHRMEPAQPGRAPAVDQDGRVLPRPEGDPHPPGARRRAGAAPLRGDGGVPRDAPPGLSAGDRRGGPADRPRAGVPRGGAEVPRLPAGPRLGKGAPASVAAATLLRGRRRASRALAAGSRYVPLSCSRPAFALLLLAACATRYQPVEGHPVLAEIKFQGNKNLSSGDLQGHIATQPTSGFFSKTARYYDADLFAIDVKRIERWYNQKGYYMAK